MATLHIHLLGEFRLQRDGVSLRLPTQKACVLLAYLITYRDRPHSRAVLAGLLWGDMPETRARRNLTDTLWRIRQVIGPGYFRVHRHALCFDPDADYWLDVEEFERLIKQVTSSSTSEPSDSVADPAILREAADLYKADFLEGFYDDWCLLERERLRTLYLTVLRALLAHYKRRGEYETALYYGQRLVMDDPLREEAHRGVMQLLALLGRRSAALRQYLVCRRTLAEELGVEPLPETTALYRQIRRAVVARPAVSPSVDFGRMSLVGRERERATALARLEAAIQGRGGALLIEGEAGIGKTRLVDEIVTGARWREVAVGAGRSRDLVEPPAYSPLVEILRQVLTPLRAAQLRRMVGDAWLCQVSVLLPEIAEWLPDLPPRTETGSGQDRDRLLEALTRVLQGLGRISPHLLILEDLHWADAATLGALSATIPQLRSTRVLVLVTTRPEEIVTRSVAWESLQTLDRDGVLERIVLSCLTPPQVDEFAARALVDPPAGLAERLYQETLGNPLFLVETLTAWRDEGILIAEGPGQWTWHAGDEGLDQADLPADVRTVIQRRLDRLTQPARQVLNAAAVIGTEVDFEVLDAACALPGETCLAALEELVRRRVLVEEPSGYRFSHDQVRQVAYESLPPARRQSLHQQVGLILEARSPEQVESLVYHFWQGDAREKAAAYSLAAGDRAQQVYAPDAALAHYGRVVELGPAAGDQLPQALLRRCQAWMLVGQYDRALEDCAALYRWGQEYDDVVAMSQALERSGWFHRLRGEFDQGLAKAQQARMIAERANEPRLLIDALRTAATLHGSRGDFGEALDLFHQALSLAQERNDQAKVARLWHNIGFTHLLRGDNDAALAVFDETLARRRALGDKRDVAHTLANSGDIHLDQGHLDAAQAAFEEAQAIWQELALRRDSLQTRIGWGAVQRARGRWSEALRTFEEALTIARGCGDRQYENAIQQNLGFILIAQGRYAQAQAALEAARLQAQKLGVPILVSAALRELGTLYRTIFAARQALACYQEAEATTGGRGHKGDEAKVQCGLGLAWLMLGDREEARRRLERAAALAQAAQSPVTWLMIANSLAILDLAVGAPVAALARVTEVAEQAAALGWVELVAQAHLQQGEALLALGRAEEATAVLRQALALADDVGLLAVQWQTCAALGRTYHAQGQLPAARAALARAVSIVEDLAEHIDDAALRAGFLAAGPVRRLYQAQATLGRQVHVRLARPGAPTGRPLTGDERVSVAWTVDAGEPDAELLAAEGKVVLRRTRILRLLDEAAVQGGVPTEQDLATALDVSVRTIRSDIADLRRAGHNVHTRGVSQT